MKEDIIDLAGLLKDRHRVVLKRYEMSKATFQHLERQLANNLVRLKPEEQRSTALWGIPIHFDNDIPLGEIKPIYA